jgi:hypothetical protein
MTYENRQIIGKNFQEEILEFHDKYQKIFRSGHRVLNVMTVKVKFNHKNCIRGTFHVGFFVLLEKLTYIEQVSF